MMLEPDFDNQLLEWSRLYTNGCAIVNNQDVLNTATFSFIDTGKVKLGITNYHVYEYYQNEKKKDSSVRFYLGNIDLDLSKLLIEHNKKLDIATFNFNSLDVKQINQDSEICFCTVENWPPQRPNNGDVVFHTSYPGKFVILDNLPEIEFRTMSIVEQIEACLEDSFIITRDLDDPSYELIKGTISLKSFTDQGGMSGTLVLKGHDSNKILRPIPAGIIYEGYVFSNGGQVTRARYLDCIDEYGRFI